MTAGLFAEHGVWTGSCRPPHKLNPKGFFENLPLKKVLKRRWPDIMLGNVARPQTGFREEVKQTILEDGYEGGPWLVKMSTLYWPAWDACFDPKYVCVRRDRESVFQSCKDSGMLVTRKEDGFLKQIIDLHFSEMDRVGCPSVYTGQLVQGDFGSLREAMAHCGIEMDEEKVRRFVNPEHWHYRAA